MDKKDRTSKFEELAEKRVNEALKRIRLVGKLSNKSNYSYTEEHTKQIIRALEEEVKALKGKFADVSEESREFKFAMR